MDKSLPRISRETGFGLPAKLTLEWKISQNRTEMTGLGPCAHKTEVSHCKQAASASVRQGRYL